MNTKLELDTIRNIDLYYFSGTGNTFLVVSKMKEVFNRTGIDVILKRIEDSNPKSVNLNKTLGLAFPVAGFSTYGFIWNFIESLPKANGTPVFMIDTLAGWSGAIVGPLKRVLEEKGFQPVGAKEIIMPANIFYVYPEKLNRILVNWGIKRAQKYAEQLISGKAHWTKFPLFSEIGYFIYKRLIVKAWASNWNQKNFKFKTDKNKCTKCGTCVKMCPVKNISMKEYPEHGYKCEFCMRCVSWCLDEAIPCSFNFKHKTYKAPDMLSPVEN